MCFQLHVVRYFIIQYNNNYLLTGAFNPVLPSILTNILEFKSTTLSYVFYLPCRFYVPFSHLCYFLLDDYFHHSILFFYLWDEKYIFLFRYSFHCYPRDALSLGCGWSTLTCAIMRLWRQYEKQEYKNISMFYIDHNVEIFWIY